MRRLQEALIVLSEINLKTTGTYWYNELNCLF